MPRLTLNRRFIALVSGLAVAVTAFTASSARADERDVLRALGGVATLYALGKVIEEARGEAEASKREAELRAREAQRAYRDRQADQKAQQVHQKGQRDWRNDHRGWNQGWQRRGPAALPSACLIQTRGYGPRAYGARCLERTYRDANLLPRACRIRVDGRHDRDRRAYLAPCLRHRGFVSDRATFRRGW